MPPTVIGGQRQRRSCLLGGLDHQQRGRIVGGGMNGKLQQQLAATGGKHGLGGLLLRIGRRCRGDLQGWGGIRNRREAQLLRSRGWGIGGQGPLFQKQLALFGQHACGSVSQYGVIFSTIRESLFAGGGRIGGKQQPRQVLGIR
ncbi:hypothetical protein D3C84_993260 [compost metagenome]